MATHSSVLAWRIPGTGEPGGLLSMGSHSQTQLKQFSSSSRSSSKMSIFNLAISCLTISNLPWFMDLTFQVPIQYFSLQHWSLLSSSDTSTTELCFGLAAFFLELLVIVLLSSSVAYWSPSNTGSSSFGLIFFGHFVQFLEFSWLVYWSGLPLPPPVDHILSELSTMICPFYVALHGMAHSFTELCKPLHHDKAVIHEGASSLDAIYSCSIITFPWSRPSLRKWKYILFFPSSFIKLWN